MILTSGCDAGLLPIGIGCFDLRLQRAAQPDSHRWRGLHPPPLEPLRADEADGGFRRAYQCNQPSGFQQAPRASDHFVNGRCHPHLGCARACKPSLVRHVELLSHGSVGLPQHTIWLVATQVAEEVSHQLLAVVRTYPVSVNWQQGRAMCDATLPARRQHGHRHQPPQALDVHALHA